VATQKRLHTGITTALSAMGSLVDKIIAVEEPGEGLNQQPGGLGHGSSGFLGTVKGVAPGGQGANKGIRGGGGGVGGLRKKRGGRGGVKKTGSEPRRATNGNMQGNQMGETVTSKKTISKSVTK